MPTMRLVPSTYYLSSSSYLSVTDASDMYDNTDSTTYATVTNSRTSTTSYYIYLRGFNFDDIPTGAIVTDFEIKLKARESGVSTSTSYKPYLANGTSAINGTCDVITTTATVHTFSDISADWDTIVGYGSEFGIRINCRRASRNTTAYMYIYGAEIEVTYTLPIYHTVTATATAGTISPSGQTSVLEGSDYSLVISGITPVVTDNGVDVTSQLVQETSGTDILIPESYDHSGLSVSNITNAYTDADSSTYAELELAAGGTEGVLYLNLTSANLPSDAVIYSISCEAALAYNRNGSSSGFTASMQLYSASSPKGSSTVIVSDGSIDVERTKFTLSPGSWGASELNNVRLRIDATNNARGTIRYLYVYGVSFSVTYETDGVVYVYTISNVTGDHVIIVTEAVLHKLFVKQNGTWTQYTKAYKKVNGTWVEQSDLTSVFDSTTNYVKGD